MFPHIHGLSLIFLTESSVEVNGTHSEFLPVSCGVPQGNILGPLLFLVYINDMNISLNCRLSLYADDSALLFSHKDSRVIAERLSCELTSCRKDRVLAFWI